MSQPTTSYTTSGQTPSAAGQPPPADDGSHIHQPQRIMLLVVRAVTYLVYGVIIAVQIILLVGFLLLLLGANPSSSFVEWWYRNLDRVMEPFRGIFTPVELGTTSGNVQSIFETSVLFAMIVYLIVGIIVSAAASWLGSRLSRLDAEDRAYHERLAYERQAYLDRASAEQVAATNAANLEAVARGASSTGSAGSTTAPPPPPGGTPPPPA